MSNNNTTTVEILENENDELLLATDKNAERKKRAAALVAVNHIPSEKAFRTLTPTEPLAKADIQIQDLLNASQEEDDQPFEFIPPKMKIAPGSVQKFILDSGEPFDELTGIVAISQSIRAWWPAKELSNMPPLCSSHDGKLGYFSDLNDEKQMEDADSKYALPHPAIPLLMDKTEEFPDVFECSGCPMNQWASDPAGGRGKACRERRRLLLILDDFQSPVIFSLPPTSIRQFDMLASGLKAQGLKYYGVRVNIRLMSQQSGGWTYGVANFAAKGLIDSIEQAQAVVSIRHEYAELVRTMPIQPEEFNEVKTPF